MTTADPGTPGVDTSARSGSVRRVTGVLRAQGITAPVTVIAAGARTAADAARSVGCAVDQIAKSIVFRPDGDGPPVVVVARGGQRVDEGKVQACLGVRVRRADPEYVRAATGFAIGGVAPVGHTGPVTLLLDAGLFQYSAVWAAAGAPDAVVCLTPADLVRLTGSSPANVTIG